MISIITLLLVLICSILVTRVATVILTHTGLSRQTARFQARSAFTGVGFTTSESEKLVNHPVRRRILLLLMLLGNAGIVTAVSTLIISFIDIENAADNTLWIKIIVLISGLVFLWALAASSWIDRRLSYLINILLQRYTDLHIYDYDSMLHLAGEYKIGEMQVKSSDWLADRALKQSRLRNEGVVVLGITRQNGAYIGAPFGDTVINPDDTLILYGRSSSIKKLDLRKKGILGDIDHAREVDKQRTIIEKEKKDKDKTE